MWETWVGFLGWEDALEEDVAIHSVFLPGESHGQRSLVGYSPWGLKESNTTERLSTHSISQLFKESGAVTCHDHSAWSY